MKTWYIPLLLLGMALLLPLPARAETAVNLLEKGTKGNEVQMVQKELIRLGFLEDSADGVYGPKTRKALSAWCRENQVDRSAVTLLGVLIEMRNRSEETPENITADPSAVYIAQKLLQRWGLYSGKIDSKYGGGTEEAVKAFVSYAGRELRDFEKERQAEREKAWRESLPAPFLQSHLQRLFGETLPEEEKPSAGEEALTADRFDFMIGGYVPVGKTVQSGDEGEEVKRVQQRLRTLKYLVSYSVDGTFGSGTDMALKYFQQQSGLAETGICDEETQQALFAELAPVSDQYVAPYKAHVIRADSVVEILKWDGSGYNKKVKEFTCSAGAGGTPTIKGTFQAPGHLGEWYYIKKSKVWVRYAFQINGNYLFHSVLYTSKGAKNPTSTSVNNLGRNVSHGCVRLSVSDAKWLYEHCTKGMTVEIE